MSALPKHRYTAREYLALERAADYKSEFYQGEIFAMAGASKEHNRVKENLIGLMFPQLLGTPCSTTSSDQRVLIEETGLYTYPDIVVTCGPGEYDPEDKDTLTNPTALIEVLSPSTEGYDRGAKFRQSTTIRTLKEYLVVAQEEPAIERYTRQADGTWTITSFVGLAAELVFQSIPVRIPLVGIYRGVEFGEPAA
jgi:Uma2 family endonuclease